MPSTFLAPTTCHGCSCRADSGPTVSAHIASDLADPGRLVMHWSRSCLVGPDRRDPTVQSHIRPVHHLADTPPPVVACTRHPMTTCHAYHWTQRVDTARLARTHSRPLLAMSSRRAFTWPCLHSTTSLFAASQVYCRTSRTDIPEHGGSRSRHQRFWSSAWQASQGVQSTTSSDHAISALRSDGAARSRRVRILRQPSRLARTTRSVEHQLHRPQ